MKPLSLEQVIENAKKWALESGIEEDSRYFYPFALGVLKQSYKILYDQHIELINKMKSK